MPIQVVVDSAELSLSQSYSFQMGEMLNLTCSVHSIEKYLPL